MSDDVASESDSNGSLREDVSDEECEESDAEKSVMLEDQSDENGAEQNEVSELSNNASAENSTTAEPIFTSSMINKLSCMLIENTYNSIAPVFKILIFDNIRALFVILYTLRLKNNYI